MSGDNMGIYVNDLFSAGATETANFTAYVNPYLVVSKGGQYTKHIYIGSQRIVSKLGDLDSYGQDPRRIEYAGANVDGAKVDYKTKYKESQQAIKDVYTHFEIEYLGKDNDDYVNGTGFCCTDKVTKAGAIGNGNDNPELFQYYYHPDHLGSTSYITNLDGEVVQHIEYVPFGEVFIEERNNTWNTPYLFNAKELDEETGLYYYGARYYDPRTSVWLGVDPLAEDYYSISPYVYCLNNPVLLVDPDGKAPQAGAVGAVFATKFIAGAALDIVLQIGINTALNGGDVRAAINNVDYVQVGAAGVISGVTAPSVSGATRVGITAAAIIFDANFDATINDGITAVSDGTKDVVYGAIDVITSVVPILSSMKTSSAKPGSLGRELSKTKAVKEAQGEATKRGVTLSKAAKNAVREGVPARNAATREAKKAATSTKGSSSTAKDAISNAAGEMAKKKLDENK